MSCTIAKIAHDKCTGCGACYNICPCQAISMAYDSEGFLFPHVNENCIDCGRCLSVCPVEHPLQLHPTPPSYAVWAKDDIRLKSSSGGMFSLLADYVLDKGGAVCGAVYSDDWQTVHHAWAENKKELAKLRGSKYVESATQKCYQQAKNFLKKGKIVLYTGCPCQIAGLYNYLGKDYDNLITADIVCHGANSITAYQSFLKEFTDGKEIEKVDFRDKKFYSWSTPTVVYLKDGTVKKSAWDKGTWYKGFLGGVINRINCFSCVYARAERISDITLADCWQVHRINPQFDDRKGTSLVLVNSEKGKRIFDLLRPEMTLCERIPLEEIRKYNGQLNFPTPAHRSRRFFFSHLEKLGYHAALSYGLGRRFDVGLVGWWFASNYGSSLTYYALGSLLAEMGKQVLLIPIGKVNGLPWEKETQQTIDFLSKYFSVGKNRDFDRMNEFNAFCDSFMLGSDQLWTAGACGLVGYSFFLDFVARDKKKIAFSTSFGHSHFNGSREELDTARDYLTRFDAISVREKSGIALCQECFGMQVEQVIDPVFLCRKEDYDKLTDSVEAHHPNKYLLCYILDPSPEKEKAAQEIAEREHLEIITILGIKEYKNAVKNWHAGSILPCVAAEEFLHYIKHCDFLLTDSHHGTCFGIIYRKQYLALTNESRGKTRFETVAELLDLSSRMLDAPYDLSTKKDIFEPIDYEKVQINLEREKQKALLWLKNAFNKETRYVESTLNTIDNDSFRRDRGIINRMNWLDWRVNKELYHEIELLKETIKKLEEKNNYIIENSIHKSKRDDHNILENIISVKNEGNYKVIRIFNRRISRFKRKIYNK